MQLTLEILKDFKISNGGSFVKKSNRVKYKLFNCNYCNELCLTKERNKDGFCSNQCARKVFNGAKGKDPWNKGIKVPQISGSNHYLYNSDLTDEERINGRHIDGYEAWRKTVYTRDNFTCVCCRDNTGGNLRAHHKYSYADNPELRLDIENGITLCKKCHIEFHNKFGYGNNNKKQLNKFLGGK